MNLKHLLAQAEARRNFPDLYSRRDFLKTASTATLAALAAGAPRLSGASGSVEKIKATADRYREAVSKDHGTGDLGDAGSAAASGRVATLLVEADRQIPGRLDAATGAVTPADLSHPDVDDLLDDLATLAMERGAEVLVVPKEHMPTDTGVAAVFRY